MTPERFAQGMTFDDYVTFTRSPENLAREGFDIRRFSMARPRLDWSAFLRKRHTEARLTPEQIGAIRWIAHSNESNVCFAPAAMTSNDM